MASTPQNNEYDMIIIGAGPAGMASAIYGSRMGWKTLVLEKEAVGGLAAVTPIIENYPGFSEITGLEFAEKLRKQAENLVLRFKSLLK